jgi:FtsP/CotA-like multicopper oxidase with cupredoxin domain
MTSQDNSMTPQNELKQDASQSSLSRRYFLTASSAVIASLAIPGRANADSTPLQQPSPPVPAELPSIVVPPADSSIVVPPAGSPFVQPTFKLSKNGCLEEEFIAQKMKLKFNKGEDKPEIDLWSYNGQFPGPTLYANPGDTIKITLNNQLPPNPVTEDCKSEGLENKPNCFNTTNLHFHGFHVSPSSKKNEEGEIFSSDDSLIDIEPGKIHKYWVQLPDYHAPGTHWYHPHRHGSTAKQMAPGMAGAIIIKEPSKKENIVADSEDKVWLIQEVNTGTTDIYKPLPGRNDSSKPGNRPDFLINGIYCPSISMEAGKMQRWRFLNGCVTPSGFLRLKLCKYSDDPKAELDLKNTIDGDVYPMYLIAADGISFYGKPPKEYSTKDKLYKFAPGNRADFLILLNEPGTYKLITEKYPNTPATRDEVLAYVRVEEAPVENIALSPDNIPAIIPGDALQYPYLQPITAAEIVNKNPQDPVEVDAHKPEGEEEERVLTFTASGRGGNMAEFKINGKRFHEPRTKYNVGVNTAEEWVLDNTVPPEKKNVAPHPFHIHVNPFQVVAEGTKDVQNNNKITWQVIPEADRIWHDTIAIEPNTPLKIWHRFATYPGEFVLHCHILIHEDQGMMYGVEVKGDGPGPGDRVPPIAKPQELI